MDENIKIKTFIESKEKFQIFPTQEIKGKNEVFGYEKDISLSNITDKFNYTLIILQQTAKKNDDILYKKLKIRILKWLPGDKILNKDIEIKQEEIIPKKEFNINYLFYDLIKINEKVSFLFILLFKNFYLFKIYEKEENNEYELDYKEIYVEDEDNNINKSSKYLFAGNSCYNDNIVEYVFLEKPKNHFLYFIFNLSSSGIYNEEKDIKILKRSLEKKEKKYKLKKFWRGLNNDKFIFVEDESFQIVLKDDNNESKMLIYPFEMNYETKKIVPDKVPVLGKILDKTYIAVDISKLEKSDLQKDKQITFAISEIYFEKERNVFNTKLLQKVNININSKDGKYSLNRITQNAIMITDDHTIFYILLNNNCLVKEIYQFNKYNQPNFPKNYYLNNYEDFIRAYIISPKEYSITCIKINIPNEEKSNDYSNEQNTFNTFNTSNKLDIEIKDYSTFINSTTKNHLNNLIKEQREFLDKKINSTKEKMKGENIELIKNDKRIEKLSISVVETIEDIPEDKKISQQLYSNSKEKNSYQKDKYTNNINNDYNNKIDNNWPIQKNINYTNQINQNPIQFYSNKNNINQKYINNDYYYNYNNNIQKNKINNFNPTYNVNQINNIDRLKQLNQLNPSNPMNQYNQMNDINNIQNKNNNMNLIQNSMINNFNSNSQTYPNVNPKFFGYN